MKKISYILFIFIAFVLCKKSFTQNFSRNDIYKIETNVDSIIFLYEKYGALTENDQYISEKYIASFKMLFSDVLYTEVFNDIDITSEINIPIYKYIENLKKNFNKGVSITLKNTDIKSDEITDHPLKNNYYFIKTILDKEYLGIYKDGNFKNVRLKKYCFYIEFSKDIENFKISKIKANDEEAYNFIVNLSDKEFNGGNYQIAKSGYTKAQSILPGQKYPKEKLKKIKKLLPSENKIFASVYFTPLSSKIAFWGTSIWNKDSSYPKIENKSKFGINAGFELKYFFNENMAIITGLGINRYKSSLSLESFKSTENQLLDKDNDSFILHIDKKNIKETIKLTGINIPVCFRYIFNPKSDIKFYSDLGLNLSFLFSKKYNASGSDTYTGEYPKYNNVILFDIEEYGFVSDKSFNTENGIIKTKSFAPSLNISAGIIKKLNSQLILEFGPQINIGINDISTSKGKEDHYLISPVTKEYNNPDADITYNGLSNVHTDIKIFTFGFKLSLSVQTNK